ncbi:MAG: hypothetical protein NVV74_11130 [Magnetospirillum sp.]|nr:hypothetical protein [Magnetospirillum sp.]
MAEKQAEKLQPDPAQEQRREDARQAFGEEPSGLGRTAESVRSGVVGGLDGVHSVATESVNMVRDVASDTVRAIGDVGTVAIGTTHDLLVGVADGLRDVITHVLPFGSGRRQPPAEQPGQRP